MRVTINAVILISGYVPVRILSYIMNPRPYLWWHLVLDAAVIFCIVLMTARKTNECS
jgi:hypothetical protein